MERADVRAVFAQLGEGRAARIVLEYSDEVKEVMAHSARTRMLTWRPIGKPYKLNGTRVRTLEIYPGPRFISHLLADALHPSISDITLRE